MYPEFQTHLVCGSEIPEFVLGFRIIWVPVWMMFLRQLAIRFLDLIDCSRPRHTQDLVEVSAAKFVFVYIQQFVLYKYSTKDFRSHIPGKNCTLYKYFFFRRNTMEKIPSEVQTLETEHFKSTAQQYLITASTHNLMVLCTTIHIQINYIFSKQPC